MGQKNFFNFTVDLSVAGCTLDLSINDSLYYVICFLYLSLFKFRLICGWIVLRLSRIWLYASFL